MNEGAAAQGAQTTGTESNLELLRNFCQEAAKGSLERAGLLLGRDTEELNSMLGGEMEVDEDLAMKIRGIAQERDIDVK